MLNVEQNSAIIDVTSVQDVPEGRMRRFEVNETGTYCYTL